MEIRNLGQSGLRVSSIGLGCNNFGGRIDEAATKAVIHKALDVGITLFDTADVYGERGGSEVVMGRILGDDRKRIVLATKFAGPMDDSGEKIGGSRQYIMAAVEDSLRRLKTDWIDLYQIHWPDPDPKIEEGWGEIAKAVEAGKVRYAGVSNFNPAQMARIQGIHPITSLQPPYSMLRRDVEKEILPFCGKNGIGVICYSPLQMGILSGSFTRERAAALARDDLRSSGPHFTEPALSRNLALVERLRPIAERNGRSVGELALAWVLHRPEVTAAIVGGRRPGQARGLAAAADWNLSREDMEEIAAALVVREATA